MLNAEGLEPQVRGYRSWVTGCESSKLLFHGIQGSEFETGYVSIKRGEQGRRGKKRNQRNEDSIS
jgi:hypothetical protein